MAGANNWRNPADMEGWMRNMEKRMLGVERRPVVGSAANIMGPGLAPHAVTITDWNSDQAAFNGFFYSTITSTGSPDAAKGWLGQTIALDDGYGIQIAYPVHDDTGALNSGPGYIRRFFVPGGATPRIYNAWVLL